MSKHSKFFDGSPFTQLELLTESGAVESKFKEHPNYESVISNYGKYESWWSETKKVINGCHNIASDSGKKGIITSHTSHYSFDGYHRVFLANPAAFKSFDVWALYHTAKNVELEFIERCKAKRNEPSLTGKFTEVISYEAKKIQDRYENKLFLTGSNLNLSEIELQIQGRETKVGADIGLLLEWKDELGKLHICPIILQAKRLVSEIADISQRNENVGRQYDVLTTSKANPVYMFYHCDTQNNIVSPRAITIKKIENINIINQEYKTSAVDGVLSLSSFFLEIMSCPQKYKLFTSRFDSLVSILGSINESDACRIFSFSVDIEAGLKYKEEYEKYICQKKLKNDVESENYVSIES